MPATNVLANLFVTIDNTESRRKSECTILPASKLSVSVLNVLKKMDTSKILNISMIIVVENLKSNYLQRYQNVVLLHQDSK